MKKLVNCLLMSVVAIAGYSQTVKSVTAENRNNKVLISYDLTGLATNQSTYVKVYYTKDKVNFTPIINGLSGDANKSISTNGKKSIVWDVVQSDGSLVGDFAFKIETSNSINPVSSSGGKSGITSRIISAKRVKSNLVLEIEIYSNQTTTIQLSKSRKSQYLENENGSRISISQITSGSEVIFGFKYGSLSLKKNVRNSIKVEVKRVPSNYQINTIKNLTISDISEKVVIATPPFIL